jgi:excisionase family DNA binding protein
MPAACTSRSHHTRLERSLTSRFAAVHDDELEGCVASYTNLAGRHSAAPSQPLTTPTRTPPQTPVTPTSRLEPLEPMNPPLVSLAEPLLTAEQVAALLGVPRSSIYEYARRRRDPLPSIEIGRHRRFYRADLERWLAEQRHR